MKGKVWVGVSISLLASLAQAQAEIADGSDQVLSGEDVANIGEHRNVQPTEDGRYLYIRESGYSVIVTPEQLELARSLRLNESPSFRSSLPCIGRTVPK